MIENHELKTTNRFFCSLLVTQGDQFISILGEKEKYISKEGMRQKSLWLQFGDNSLSFCIFEEFPKPERCNIKTRWLLIKKKKMAASSDNFRQFAAERTLNKFLSVAYQACQISYFSICNGDSEIVSLRTIIWKQWGSKSFIYEETKGGGYLEEE